jgi:hypothetical protein
MIEALYYIMQLPSQYDGWMTQRHDRPVMMHHPSMLAIGLQQRAFSKHREFFLTSSMENLSQLVTQEDDLCLHVLRITHHCYGLALNTSRSPRKEASA